MAVIIVVLMLAVLALGWDVLERIVRAARLSDWFVERRTPVVRLDHYRDYRS